MTGTKYHMNLRKSQSNCWILMPETFAKVVLFVLKT